VLSPWNDLPNAKHIDFVLEHMQKYPTEWVRRRAPGWADVWYETKDLVRSANRNEYWYVIIDRTNSEYSVYSRSALLALIAYDDCAHLLYSDPAEVELLAKLGVPAAVLLLTASSAISSTKEANAKSLG
jgi:hypothetical protein